MKIQSLLQNIKQKEKSADLIAVAVVAVLSFLVHFWRITYPNSIVFDEVTFGKFLNAYAKGEYYFDLHPPLGKLLLYWAGYLGGLDPEFKYDQIGTVFTDHAYIWIRSLTAAAGTLIPIAVLALMRGLGFSVLVSLTAALLVVFENALVVISRTFVFDIFLVSFGFASLACGAWAHRSQSTCLRWCAWILAVASFSIKWTGLSFLGVLTLWDWQKGRREKQLPEAWHRILRGWGAAFCVYFLIFVVHFSMTPNSGLGNDFMTAEFQSGLVGSRYYGRSDLVRPNIFGQFIELNKMMWAYQKTMNQTHPYSSAWYTWPIMQRPIYFWGETSGVIKERIYLLGNPLLWWASLLAVLAFALNQAKNWRFWLREKMEHEKSRNVLLLILFLFNYLPFVLIGRVMFLYHYLVALVVGLMILAVTIHEWSRRWMMVLFLLLALASFWYFAPLTYALPLSDAQYEQRLWFSSWL